MRNGVPAFNYPALLVHAHWVLGDLCPDHKVPSCCFVQQLLGCRDRLIRTVLDLIWCWNLSPFSRIVRLGVDIYHYFRKLRIGAIPSHFQSKVWVGPPTAGNMKRWEKNCIRKGEPSPNTFAHGPPHLKACHSSSSHIPRHMVLVVAGGGRRMGLRRHSDYHGLLLLQP